MKSFHLRTIWITSHRWLGLTVGLMMVLSGLTGSLLVFRSNIDESIHPEIFSVAGEASHRNVSDILAAARTSPVASRGSISFVDFPRSENGVWTVWYQTGTKASPELTKVYFNPFNAHITGTRVHGEDLMTWLYKLHVELLSGPTGETIVGIIGILLMISVVSGILLWWPLWRHSWRAAFSIRSGRRLNYDLHKTSGILSSVLLLIVAASGVYLTFPHWIGPAVKFVMAEAHRPAPKRPPSKGQPEPKEARISADQAVDVVRNRYPDSLIRRLHPPSESQSSYIVRFCQPGDVHRSLGSSRAWVDPQTGEITRTRDHRQQSAAETLLSWQLPLHNGEAFGITGRWVVLVTGLVPLLLYVTGFLIWWKRRVASARQRPRQAPDVSGPSELAATSPTR
ncbi:PepSY-associated TM helix domain-containing protein [Planctomicrobium sp. SH661]|uniref:PepSY-associated TM helix domain-containing protein n=1 Tax=Planctomicrobium sp. SH661 TaxID=3448124 RepID=UPI003F5BF863